MGLIWDVLKQLVVLGARFLVLVAILGVGALALKEVNNRFGDDPRVKLEEHLQEIASLKEKEADARREVDEASQQLVLEQAELQRQNGERARTHAQANAEVRARSRDQLSAQNKLDQYLQKLEETDPSHFSSERLKSTFLLLCENSGAVGADFCREWLTRAEAEAARSEEPVRWHDKLSATVQDDCGLFGVGVGASIRNWRTDELFACNANKVIDLDAFSNAVSSAEALRTANAALKDAEDRVMRASEALNGVSVNPEEAQKRYDDAVKTREALADDVQKKEAELARLSADPWVRLMNGTRWFWENIVKSYWFAAASIIAFPYMASWLIYVLAGLARHIPAFYARNRTISGRVEKDTAEEVVFSEPLGGASQERASIQAFKGVRQPVVALGKTETLLIRADYVASSRNGTTKVFYSLAYPFTSYAAGLWGLTKFQGSKTQNVVVSASGAEHHDEYIAEIVLDNHPGVVVRPSRVVAVRGDLKLSTRWNFGISSFARFQFRYFTLAGTGAVYLSAPGGVAPRVVNVGDDGEAREHLSHDLILAWDGRLGAGVARNENFIRSALLRDQDLFESSLVGTGVYLQGHSAKDAKLSGATRILNGLFDAILKVFGI